MRGIGDWKLVRELPQRGDRDTEYGGSSRGPIIVRGDDKWWYRTQEESVASPSLGCEALRNFGPRLAMRTNSSWRPLG